MTLLRLATDDELRDVGRRANDLLRAHSPALSIAFEGPYLPRTADRQFHVLTRCKTAKTVLEKTVTVSRRGVPNALDLADRVARRAITYWTTHPAAPLLERHAS